MSNVQIDINKIVESLVNQISIIAPTPKTQRWQ